MTTTMGMMTRRAVGLSLAGALSSASGCNDSDGRDTSAQTIGITLGGADATDASSAGNTEGTSAGVTSGVDGTAGPPDSGAPPKFDVGTTVDAGGGPVGPVIPETCEQAEAGASSVGCLFYGVDMDSTSDALPFAIVTANVHENQMANVSVQTRQGGVWTDVAGPVALAPLTLQQFDLADLHQENTGVRTAGSYRVVGDVPIVAYQFNPIDGASSFLSDASMLFPVPTWDSINHVINTRFQSSSPGAGYPYVTIVASVDGTNVSFTAANATTGGGPIPAAAAGQTVNFTLNDGDVATIVAANQTQTLSGSRVVTDMQHPVGVLPGHTCVNIPDNVCCCDHLEEQLSGVRQWGTSFVAAHMPVRNPGAPEATFWQIYASEDATTVTFDGGPMLSGVPAAPVNLQAGGITEIFVTAPAGIEADFAVNANKPIAVVGYMTSSENFGGSIGDPAMAQYVSVEQFLPRYVVLVPGTWINDILVLTRPAGAQILLDGVPVDDALFRAVGDGTWEVARVPAADGVHVLDGNDNTFGVVVVGYDMHDSYAYVGGTGTGIINPNPEG
jgi:hypothetical protein